MFSPVAVITLLALLPILSVAGRVGRAPTEGDRVREWYENGNTWPPTWQNETAELRTSMDLREIELMMIPGRNERWENYMQFTSSRMVPRFTELGFEVVSTPPEVAEMLKEAVDDGINNWDDLRFERKIDAVYTPIQSKFVNMKGKEWEAIRALQGMHEEWSGLKLKPTSSYGVRLYQNGSSLVMHYDKINTHVISSIVHIAHLYDNDDEPWPIEIEDHYGKVHAVSLQPGQMLFYESAACLHGRRSKLKGKYYGSLFMHYQPVDQAIWDFSINDVIANVPPHWNEGVVEDTGSRWSGQGITTESMIPQGANPRIIQGIEVPDLTEYYAQHGGATLPPHLRNGRLASVGSSSTHHPEQVTVDLRGQELP